MKDENNIRVIIVDDDTKSVESLELLINKYCPAFEIVGTAYCVQEGIEEVKMLNPDILFLDVEMPDGSGFDLLQKINKRNFDVVFVTAHNKYAINAIKHSALDYLLKPFDIQEFLETVEKIKRNGSTKSMNYDVLLENLSHPLPKKLVISSSKGYEYIPVEKIIRLESERSYARIFLTNGRKIMVSKCLNDYQNMLNADVFFRVHNSHLINLNHVVMYVRTDGGYVQMIDESKIPISRSKKDLFINTMQQFIS
jgi:two-component system LytT family response regulator